MFDAARYTIAWICTSKIELTAARAFLDGEHYPEGYIQPSRDSNCYIFGHIGRHGIIVTAIPHGVHGTHGAATVITDLLRSFSGIQAGLLVGTASAAPRSGHDIRLGDIVVSTPSRGRGGVLHFDAGHALQGQELRHTTHLNGPPRALLSAVTRLGSDLDTHGSLITNLMQDCIEANESLSVYQRPDRATDLLFTLDCLHIEGQDCTQTCAANLSNIVLRPSRPDYEAGPAVHYGIVASGDTSIRDAHLRNALAQRHDVLCIESAAAGMMNNLPTIVINGVADYADSHSSDLWRPYAAMTAAAYARLLLQVVRPWGVKTETLTASAHDMAHGKHKLGTSYQQWDHVEREQSNIRPTSAQTSPMPVKDFDDTASEVAEWSALAKYVTQEYAED